MKKYRIVTDCGGGYGCQKRKWFFFWVKINMTFKCVTSTEAYLEALKREEIDCKRRSGKVVKYV